MTKSEEEIYRKAVLYVPASAEYGIITGTCFGTHMRLCDCCGDVVKDPKENLCKNCREFAEKKSTGERYR